jgi:hypothetical protein
VDLPEPVPAGKAKVTCTPLSAARVKPGVIFNPARMAESRLTPQEALERMQSLCADSKFSVDTLLEERREDLEHEEEKYRRLFHKE